MTDSSTCITDRHREMHEANGAHPESRTRSRVRREAGSRSRSETGDGGRIPSRELAQSSRRHSSGYCRCMLLHDQPLDLWDTYSWRHARRSTGGSPRLFGSAVERAVRAVRALARLRLARHSGLDDLQELTRRSRWLLQTAIADVARRDQSRCPSRQLPAPDICQFRACAASRPAPGYC
jgi:hypothetical protein